LSHRHGDGPRGPTWWTSGTRTFLSAVTLVPSLPLASGGFSAGGTLAASRCSRTACSAGAPTLRSRVVEHLRRTGRGACCNAERKKRDGGEKADACKSGCLRLGVQASQDIARDSQSATSPTTTSRKGLHDKSPWQVGLLASPFASRRKEQEQGQGQQRGSARDEHSGGSPGA